MSSDASVYVGGWINWTRGRILGATLTLTARNGAFMVAFLALFVRLAGSHLWSIFCFAIHQGRSCRRRRDGFHHQQQAILRNSRSATNALWQLLQARWSWRSNTQRPVWRSVPLVLSATVHIAVFAVAGIFSSHVTTTNSEALIRSSHCGSWPTDMIKRLHSPNGGAFDAFLAWSIDTRHETSLSFNYARSCYNTTPFSTDCNTYVRRRLNSTVDLDADCPFFAGMCLNASSKAIQLDTRFIDSHSDLGINAPKDNRITYRRVMTCAPVETEGFTSSTVGPRTDVSVSDINNTYLNYGPQLAGDHVATNFTYTYSNWTIIANDGLGGYVLL